MKALITGASSGLGRDFSIRLSNLGYDVILVARDKKGLEETKKLCKSATIEVCDLSIEDKVFELFEKHKDIDFLINNAGYGLFGDYESINIKDELNMINVNVKALHILTKLYADEMSKRNICGRILNVASIAAFLPGPLMNTYYSTKAYVLRYSLAIKEELKMKNSPVRISVLCPGPTRTNFNNVAGVKFSIKSMTSKEVVNYALEKVFANKTVIVPGMINKFGVFLCRLTPFGIQAKFAAHAQKKKEGRKMNKKGFTLIELLAVIVVLGVIMTIAGMSVNKIRKNAVTKELKHIENSITKVGESVFSYEMSVGKNDADFKSKYEKLKNFSNKDEYISNRNQNNAEIKINLYQLQQKGYLKGINVNTTENGNYFKNPSGKGDCKGYLSIIKINSEPVFSGLISCEQYQSAGYNEAGNNVNLSD